MKGALYGLLGVLMLAADKIPRNYVDIYTSRVLTALAILSSGLGALELIQAAMETSPLPRYLVIAGVALAAVYLLFTFAMAVVMVWKGLRMLVGLLRRLKWPVGMTALARKIMSAYVAGWARAFDYKGRSTRLEYYTFMLVNGALEIGYIVGTSAYVAANDPSRSVVVGLSIGVPIIFLATVVPEIAVIVRRLRDTGRGGWLVFLVLIPIVGRLCRWWFVRQPSKPPVSN